MKKNLFNFKSNLGYTLVELLAVIVVMIIVGLIVTTLLISALRGGNKTQVINEIRDNGNTALTRMARDIEFAKSFVGIKTETGSFLENCTPSLVSPSDHFKYLKIRGFDDGETTFSCGSSIDPKISSTSAAGSMSLIDDSSLVPTYEKCYFTCTQAFLSQPPTIGINFTLTKNINSLFFEQKYLDDFQTTVVMRNLGL